MNSEFIFKHSIFARIALKNMLISIYKETCCTTCRITYFIVLSRVYKFCHHLNNMTRCSECSTFTSRRYFIE